MRPSSAEIRRLEQVLASGDPQGAASGEAAGRLHTVWQHMSRPLDAKLAAELAAVAAQERSHPSGANAPRHSWARRSAVAVFASGLWWKLFAVGVAAATAGVGAVGGLPDPIQEVVAVAGDVVGLDIPHPADIDEDATTAAASTTTEAPPATTGATPSSTSTAAGANTSSTTSSSTTSTTESIITTSTSTTVAATTTPSTTLPPGSEVHTFGVGTGGSVTITRNWNSVTIGAITTNPDWTHEIEKSQPDQIDIKFRHSSGDATFKAQVDSGTLQIDIDPGPLTAAPPDTPQSATFSVGIAGSVTITRNWNSVTIGAITANPDWTHEIEKVQPDQIDIKFRHASGDATFKAQVDSGTFQIDIDPG